jgi:rhodanese-related sulfurtransferase
MTMTAMEMVAEAKQKIREVDAAQAQDLLGKVLVLDVREPTEYAAGCLPGAVNIPRGTLEFKIDGHPAFQGKRDADILVYCLSGGRSALAVETLQKLGWGKAVSLAGGFGAWQNAGGQVVSPAA